MVLPDLSDVFADHVVDVAYLFGSRAEGTARHDSDHDVAVLFGSDPGLVGVEMLARDLRRRLGTPVDVVDLDKAPLELRGTVAERGRLIHSTNEPRRVRFEVRSRMLWIEFKPVLEAATRAFLAGVAGGGATRG